MAAASLIRHPRPARIAARLPAILAALLVLAACGAREPVGGRGPGPSPVAEPAAPDPEASTRRCQAYGYEPGTADWAECLRLEELDRRYAPKAFRWPTP